MYSYCLLFLLLVISTAANNIPVAEEDFIKLIVSATELCRCSSNPIEDIDTATENCTSHALQGMQSDRLAPIDKVCENIRAINDKFKTAEIGPAIVGVIHGNGSLAPNSTYKEMSNGTEVLAPNSTYTEMNNGTEVLAPYSTYSNGSEGLVPDSTHREINNGTKDMATESIPISNGTEDLRPKNINETTSNRSNVLAPNSTYSNGSEGLVPDSTHREINNGTKDMATESIPISNGTEDLRPKNINETTSNRSDNLAPNSSYSNRPEGLVPDSTHGEKNNGTKGMATESIPTSNGTEGLGPISNSTISKLNQTSDTLGAAAPKEHLYPLSSILITFFCALGAGILIAVGSKILYSRYRERTYEIPAEQELH